MAGKKLLVVDDSLTIQKVIRLALSNEGYEIQACSDGSEALQQIALFRPDVALVDVSLPGKSAFEIKAEVNADPELAKVRFVLMSSAFEQVDEIAAEKVSFHARLIKPFDPAHLRQVLTDVLATMKEQPAPAPKKPALDESSPSLLITRDDIWGNAGPLKLSDPAPPPAHIDGPAAHESLGEREDHTDTDIRRLTEATIKMSGLDEFQWSVSDDGPKQLPDEPPSLKPHPHLADAGNTSFRFSPDRPPENMKETYGDLPLTPPPAGNTASAGPAQVAPVSSSDVEDAVRKHLESTLERMAQKMLPEIAEKVIRKEIHRLLSEIP